MEEKKIDAWFVDSISVINFDFAVVRLIKECDYTEEIYNFDTKNIVVPISLLEEDFLYSKKEFLENYYRDNKKSCIRNPSDPFKGKIKQGATYTIPKINFDMYSKLAGEMGL